jgi:arylsulfatase A-like enzyme
LGVVVSVLQRTLRAISIGCLIGCAAGVASALADFGAQWLWLDRWADRALLLLRLAGVLVPIGALVGATAGMALSVGEGSIEALAAKLSPRTGLTRERLARTGRALRATVCLAPGLIAIGVLLFRGGSMARLAGKVWWQVLVCAVLLAGAFALAYLAHALHAWAHTRPGRLRVLASAAMALALALAKLNQWVLPKLYDYLHGALTAASFALLMLGALWLGSSWRWPRTTRLGTVAFAPALVLAVAALWGTLSNLDRNQNVRVALLHPNAAHSRSVMQAIAPYVIEPAQRRAMQQARLQARLARARRGPRAHVVGPVHEDAHVLLITVDALRADHLGSYGYRRDTSPHLDRLAAQSVVFEHAYAPAPHSSYSLCSMMTSEYLHETLDLGRAPPSATLPSALAQAGYHTAAFYTGGIFHTAAERLEVYEQGAFGFALHDPVTYTAEELTERALGEVDRTVARGEPNSLLWVHYFDVHEPYRSTHFGSSDMDRYDSEIRHVDGEVERLIRGVRQRLSRDVIVIVSADHGEEFHEHGGVYHGSTVYEEQVRVPLIVNAPGLQPRRVAAPVSTIDIAPTLLGFLGLPASESMRGRDLRPLAIGVEQPPQPVFSAVIHKKMVVQWPYKLIADLRFGLFELYQLERDPHERDNLADRAPERVSELRMEVYGWLDSLAPNAAEVQHDPIGVALDWGRLGDRRAVEPLSRLVADPAANAARRIDAARMLGHLADKRAAASLLTASEDARAPLVAAEAAIALGRMYDPRARSALRRLVRAEDADIRVRAAVSLGRLRDTEAVPALIESLFIAKGEYERQEAIRWLGRLRDRRALEPLIDVLPELRTRFLAVVAIGQIGDRRAYDRLAQVLAWDRHANVRDSTIQGLGLLGDPRAIELIAPLAAEDHSLTLATESLVRLGAIASGAIGGADVSHGQPALGEFTDCHEGPPRHDWDYLHRTFCVTRGSRAELPLRVPAAVSEAELGSVVALAVKRSDDPAPTQLRVTLGTRVLEPVQIDGSWNELRWNLPADTLATGSLQARLESEDPAARFAVDHLLILPRTTVMFAARSENTDAPSVRAP